MDRPQHGLTSGGSTCAEELIRHARIVLDNCGHPMGQNQLSRLVRTFQSRVERNGFAFFDFLATSVQMNERQRWQALNDPDVRRAIAYADPTGDTAVRNVMAEARR